LKHNLSGHEKLYESQCLKKDGSVFPVEVQGRSVRHEGRAVRVTAVRDVTERKETEETLRLTQFSVERTADAIFWMAPDGRILYANDSACTTYGFSREELIRMTVFELNPDYSRESWMELVKQTREAGHSRYESRNLRKDGGIFPVEVTANHLEFGGQEYIFGFVRDITERKESEEALRLTQFSVERAGDGRFQKVNDAATRCFGYSREELLSMSVWDIQLDRSAEAWPERWEEIKRTGTSTFETRYAAKDGRTVPVEITTSYLEFGSKEWSFGFVRDITERKRTEEALRPSEERHRILFERANNAINVLDETGRILDCNLKACELFGYEREELIGKPRTEMMPPERRAILSETIAQIMRTGQERFESVAIRKAQGV
jgi:PAS domain S-box-containing protein